MRTEVTLIVFAKAPVVGYAKRRLIPLLGATGAASLHAWLVEHLLTRLAHLPVKKYLYAAPDTDHPLLRRSAGRNGFTLVAQHGADLGARMADALATGLRESTRVLLMGSDIPDLDAELLAWAQQALTPETPLVLVPTEDGGYALVGVMGALPPIFSGMAWGGEQVLQETRSRLRQAGVAWREWPRPLRDLDRPADLHAWLAQAPEVVGSLPLRVREALMAEQHQQITEQQEQGGTADDETEA